MSDLPDDPGDWAGEGSRLVAALPADLAESVLALDGRTGGAAVGGPTRTGCPGTAGADSAAKAAGGGSTGMWWAGGVGGVGGADAGAGAGGSTDVWWAGGAGGVGGADAAAEAAAGWAASGAMWLTGHPDGPPLAPAAAVVPALEAAARTVERLAESFGGSATVDVPRLLAGRAALLGLRRRGRISANGSCRLLPAADGWVALNLARPSDVESLPAVLERPVPVADPWPAVAAAVAGMPADAFVERARLLSLPAARLPAPPPIHPAPPPAGSVPQSAAGPSPSPAMAVQPRAAALAPVPHEVAGTVASAPGPFEVVRLGGTRDQRPRLVVDLSAMWAGPTCAQILGQAGLRVVKVESTRRPDGARTGDARFYSWLHAGHESVALDLTSERGRRSLRSLVRRADVVIESSRPRALAQLGVDAAEVVAAGRGVTWVSITGYGRRGEAANRVAFGDDAAVAAGLVALDDRGDPVFCADAVADPVTGLYAALAALASQAAGGGHLVDVAMVRATAFAAGTAVARVTAIEARPGEWRLPRGAGPGGTPIALPLAPPEPPTPARPLGADTARVLAELTGPGAAEGAGARGGGWC